MPAHNPAALDAGQLDMMWNFLRSGYQKPNISALKELCEQLRHAMLQKTGGQEPYKKAADVPMEDVPTIVNCIVIETMCLYLSGGLDRLEEREADT